MRLNRRDFELPGLFVAEIGDADVVVGGQFFGPELGIDKCLVEYIRPVTHLLQVPLGELNTGLDHLPPVSHE